MERAEAEVREKARDYLRTRGTLMPTPVLRERIGGAFQAVESFLDTVPAARATARPIPGEWSIQEVVDHLIETYRPGVDELRCLLAGQRPPGEPIPASLQSKAPLLRPWPWLRQELARLHADVLAALDGVAPDFETPARAPLVMVFNVPREGGGFVPLHWVEDLDWKAYAIVSWRLHAIDHLNQGKKVLATLSP